VPPRLHMPRLEVNRGI